MSAGSDDAAAAAALRRLRAVLDQASREARSTQGAAQSGVARFMSVSDEVVAVVGGSAQRVDQAVVTSLNDAKRQVDAAVTALGAVSGSS